MLIYVDETGDHDLIHISEQYPIFGLGALLISKREYKKMDKEIKSLKKEFFDDDGSFILHSLELKRPNHKKSDKRNQIMLNPDTRKKFYEEFDKRIIQTFDFKILVCFIIKKRMVKKYVYPNDPYLFSFENTLNRIIRYGDEKNFIYAEKRGEHLDTCLEAEYEKLCKTGIYSYSAKSLSKKTSFEIIDKKNNISGLQVIDLILSTIARYGTGKKEKMTGNDLTFSLIKTKYACSPTIFPSKK